jgi:inner membrane protein
VPSVFSHAVAGAALGSLFRRPGPPPRFWIAGALCAVVPDLDVVPAYLFDFPWRHILGHRGLTHSLPFAAVFGAVVTLVAFRGPAWRGRRGGVWLYLAVATASHGVLDAMNTARLGVAFFAPFDHTRYLLPWQFIPVSPFGLRFFSARGLEVFKVELLMIWLPSLLLVLAAWVARRRGPR